MNRRTLAVYAYRNLCSKITVDAKHGDVKRYALGKIAIKLHVAVETNAAHHSVARASILPQRVPKLADFLMRQTLSTMTPIQAILVGNATILLRNR